MVLKCASHMLATRASKPDQQYPFLIPDGWLQLSDVQYKNYNVQLQELKTKSFTLDSLFLQINQWTLLLSSRNAFLWEQPVLRHPRPACQLIADDAASGWQSLSVDRVTLSLFGDVKIC